MYPAALLAQAEKLLADARTRKLKIVTAESCTGGLIAGLLTEIAGSSDVFERGFVTYSNESKQELLGVPNELIARHGDGAGDCAGGDGKIADAAKRGDDRRGARDGQVPSPDGRRTVATACAARPSRRPV